MEAENKKKKIVVVKKKIKKSKNTMTTIDETQETNTSKSEINTANNTTIIENEKEPKDCKELNSEIIMGEKHNENITPEENDNAIEKETIFDYENTIIANLQIESITEEIINSRPNLPIQINNIKENKINENENDTNPLKLDLICEKVENNSLVQNSILNKYLDNKTLTYIGAAVSMVSISYYMYRKFKK